MAGYIEREAVKKMLENAQIISDGEYSGYCTEDINVDDIPTEDVAPVVHGEIGYRNRPEHYDSYKLSGQTEDGEPLYKREHHILENNPVGYCSECGKRLCSRFTNYCPSCGAKMEEAR